MKISICSDLHLEFGDLDFDNTESAQVLVLSGDICVARDMVAHDTVEVLGIDGRSGRYHKFFQRCSERFEHVVYIAGNHEHYHHDFAKTVKVLIEKELWGLYNCVCGGQTSRIQVAQELINILEKELKETANV